MPLKKMFIMMMFFFSYDANNITHIRKNINFDIYSLVTDKKYIHAIEGYKYFEVPDYTLLDENNNECKKIQNKLNKLIVELYKFDNQLRQYFISKQTSNNEDDTLEKLILVDEIKYSYDVSLKHYDFGNNKQRVNYILVCAYLKDFSVLTLQLNTDRFEKFAIIKNNMIKLEELNFDYLIEDLTGL